MKTWQEMTDAEFEVEIARMDREREHIADVDAGYEPASCGACVGSGKARYTTSHTHGRNCTACDGTGKEA